MAVAKSVPAQARCEEMHSGARVCRAAEPRPINAITPSRRRLPPRQRESRTPRRTPAPSRHIASTHGRSSVSAPRKKGMAA